MSTQTFRFRPRVARRIPDPNFKESHGAERHLFVMPVKAIPRDLPLDPNARNPNVRKRVYQAVEASLLNRDCEAGTFHLKNKGITIIAEAVKQVGDNEYDVFLRNGVHGIVDGGHTFKLIEQNLDSEEMPDDQFVHVEVRVGIPEQWITDIAGGLNTTVQVQDMSLDHLAGRFEWLKKELKAEPFFKTIAWSENDPGDFDARDIISLLTLFNIELFPNDRDDHPLMGYEKKSLALKEFERKPASFERMRGLLKDVLKFHDIVRKDARHLWNRETGGKAGSLAFMEKRERGEFMFPFTGASDDCRMVNGALYPILAAFRWFVVQDPNDFSLKWRDGFDGVAKVWQDIGVELMRATIQTSNELGRNANAIGKSRNHWANLHTRVAKHDLLAQQARIASGAE